MKKVLMALVIGMAAAQSASAFQQKVERPGHEWVHYWAPDVRYYGHITVHYTHDQNDAEWNIAVNTCNGNLFIDIMRGLFHQHYNSQLRLLDGRFGYGWSSLADVNSFISKDGARYMFVMEGGDMVVFQKKDGEFAPDGIRESGCKLVEYERGKLRLVTSRGTFTFADPVGKRITSYTDAGGTWGFAYESDNGVVSKLKFLKGGAVDKQYDVRMENGKYRVFSDGKVSYHYVYNDKKDLVEMRIEGGEKPGRAVMTYGENHRLTSVTDFGGRKFTFTHSLNSLTSVDDGKEGNATVFDFQKGKSVTTIHNAANKAAATKWIRFTYKEDREQKWYLALVEDSEGRTIDYEKLPAGSSYNIYGGGVIRRGEHP